MNLLLGGVGKSWSARRSHWITTCRANLADGCIVSHVGRVKKHGGVPRKVRGLCDGRGRNEGAVLEDAAVGLYRYRHMHCIGDGGALELRQQGILEKVTLVGMCVGEGDTETAGGPLCFRLSQTLLLGPAVLEPNLNLCLGQL